MGVPVLVGVGIATQNVTEPGSGDEAWELMADAAARAAQDAGAPGLLAKVQRIAVPSGSWSYPDPAHLVAQRLGCDGARTVLVEVGIPQQTLVSDALQRILHGEIDVALVVGGEARRRSSVAERAGV